jgi:hypothetical protein
LNLISHHIATRGIAGGIEYFLSFRFFKTDSSSLVHVNVTGEIQVIEGRSVNDAGDDAEDDEDIDGGDE